MNTQFLNTLCDAMCKAERQAAQLVLQAHHVMAENKTGQKDVVTEYDRKVQDQLIKSLGEAFLRGKRPA